MTTILLVEEDPLQALVRISILKNRFPHVRRVADAAEALCLIEQPGFCDDLGLVISAHHLSGLGAPAFVAELRTRIPGLPILVLGDNQETAGEYAGRAVRFLPKPIATEEMLGTAAQMLEGAGQSMKHVSH